MTKLVLLVDDDAHLRALLRVALRSRGFEIAEAGSVREAETVLGDRSPDLIMVDGLLPDGRGIDLIEAIRRRDRHVRLVFVSAFFRDLTTFTRLTTEFDVALVAYKPIDPPHFASKVVELLASDAGPHASPPVEPAGSPDHIFELAMLHKEFSQRLPDKLAELAEATRAATLDRSCVNTARMLAHRLRGSAGSYGHPAVGATAGIIEELLAEVDIDGVDRQFLWKELEQALHDAHAAVASVVTARSADEAIQGASAQPLVAAIPEVHLDQEDSFGCARRLRGAPHDAELPIAISSTDSSLETRAVAVAAGEVRVCDTPITEEHLGELGLGLVRESGAR